VLRRRKGSVTEGAKGRGKLKTLGSGIHLLGNAEARRKEN